MRDIGLTPFDSEKWRLHAHDLYYATTGLEVAGKAIESAVIAGDGCGRRLAVPVGEGA
jgi:hypothetical protein